MHDDRLMEKYERLQALLELLRTKFCEGKTAALARAIHKDESYVGRLFYASDKKGAKGIGPEITDACTAAFKLPRGFWDMAVEEAKLAVGLVDETSSSAAVERTPLEMVRPTSQPTLTIEQAFDVLAAALHRIGEDKSRVVLGATAIHAKNPQLEVTARNAALSLLLGEGGSLGGSGDAGVPLEPTGSDR